MYVCICANVEYMCTLVHCEYISLSSFKEVLLFLIFIVCDYKQENYNFFLLLKQSCFTHQSQSPLSHPPTPPT